MLATEREDNFTVHPQFVEISCTSGILQNSTTAKLPGVDLLSPIHTKSAFGPCRQKKHISKAFSASALQAHVVPGQAHRPYSTSLFLYSAQHGMYHPNKSMLPSVAQPHRPSRRRLRPPPLLPCPRLRPLHRLLLFIVLHSRPLFPHHLPHPRSGLLRQTRRQRPVRLRT